MSDVIEAESHIQNKLPKQALKFESHWDKEILDTRRETDGTNYTSWVKAQVRILVLSFFLSLLQEHDVS